MLQRSPRRRLAGITIEMADATHRFAAAREAGALSIGAILPKAGDPGYH